MPGLFACDDRQHMPLEVRIKPVETLLFRGEMVAVEKFCHGDWSKIKKYNSFDEGELLLFCFSSAYINALLHDTLKMPLHRKR